MNAIEPIHTASSIPSDTHGDNEISDADVRAFEERLTNDTDLTYEEFEEQFDRNFQMQSYLFLKRVFDYAESEIKSRQ